MPRSSPSPTSALDELARDPGSRKAFLRMMGGGGAAAGLAGLLAACGSSPQTASVPTQTSGTAISPRSTGVGGEKSGNDIDILNYALTLEYLEATFYKEAEESGMVKDKAALEMLKAFGETERTHVKTISATVKQLGGTPVKAPETRFGPVIAGGSEMIVQIAATVENIGAAAYLGQAPRIQSKEVLAAALSIHTVEARHAAALNEIVGRQFKGGSPLEGSVPSGAFARPLSMEQVLAQAKPFLVN